MTATDHLEFHDRTSRSFCSGTTTISAFCTSAFCFSPPCSLGTKILIASDAAKKTKLATVKYATFLPLLAGRYTPLKIAAATNHPKNAPRGPHVFGPPRATSSLFRCCKPMFSTIPLTLPTPTITTENKTDGLLTRPSHSNPANRPGPAAGNLCFNRYD